jgi:hypothetical protein
VGAVIILSLTLGIFGTDFIAIARTFGRAFLLPIGIVTGLVISVYGAFLIGSHIEDLEDAPLSDMLASHLPN